VDAGYPGVDRFEVRELAGAGYHDDEFDLAGQNRVKSVLPHGLSVHVSEQFVRWPLEATASSGGQKNGRSE
jgi:hypothetical protein